MSKQYDRLDSNESIFFEKELEFLKSKSYDVKFPKLQFAEGNLIPVSSEAGSGAMSITYNTYEGKAMAKIISDYASDFPRAEVSGKQTTVQVRDLGISVGYNYKEVKASQRVGKSLEQRKMNIAMEGSMQKLDNIALYGDEKSGLKGLLTHPNIGEYTVPNGESTSPLFSTKTPTEILADLNAMVSKILDDTNGIEQPNTILLPLAQYNILATTARSTTSDKTILEFFLETNPYIDEIVAVPKLKGAGTAGADVMIAYDKNPNNLTLEIPDPFEMLPVTQINGDFTIPCTLSTAGVIVYYPLSICKAEGI